MKKYKHKQTGDIAFYNGNNYEVEELGLYVPDRFIKNSNDWELIPSIEVGKVYKDTRGKFMVLVKKIINNYTCVAIGFDEFGKWIESDYCNPFCCIEATKEEWLERLKEEAIKRGLVKGARFKGLFDKENSIIEGAYSLDIYGNFYIDEMAIMLEKTGKWYTVIEEKHEGTTLLNEYKDIDTSSFYFDTNRLGTHTAKLHIKGCTTSSIGIGTIHENSKKPSESIQLGVPNKKPILTTHDGVELFDGNEVWGVALQASGKDVLIKEKLPFLFRVRSNRIWFSTKEKAQEYIDLHQKKYSYSDIAEALNNLNNSFDKAVKHVQNTYSSEVLGTPYLLIGDVAELIKITTGKEVDWRKLINK